MVYCNIQTKNRKRSKNSIYTFDYKQLKYPENVYPTLNDYAYIAFPIADGKYLWKLLKEALYISKLKFIFAFP
ncbi:hypothetical protein DI53_2594 [Sphingobacterium deserti]|uniref:Uncharacterized protein n=1 Tax=Sphingobacterium deserti TaxID=1229276 RepID=A0A0B8T3K7_9SPHI|nr:hypothetical protein DI53_2594 [Sphingobacterium deserti]